MAVLVVSCRSSTSPPEAPAQADTGDGIVKGAFSGASYQRPKVKGEVDWPTQAKFKSVWELGKTRSVLIRVAKVQFEGIQDLVAVFVPARDGYHIDFISGAEKYDYFTFEPNKPEPKNEAERLAQERKEKEHDRRSDAIGRVQRVWSWTIKSGGLKAGRVVRLIEGHPPRGSERERDETPISLKVQYVSPMTGVSPERWGDWVYATGMQFGDPPVSREFSPPVGRCSRDRSPVYAMGNYADDCLAHGRLGCFLQLQARLMADRYPSRAYSTFAERSRGTQVSALQGAGLNELRYLKGLIMAFAVDGRQRENVGPMRLGRAVAEFSGRETLMAYLKVAVQDSTLDEYNRLRAAMIYSTALGYGNGYEGEQSKTAKAMGTLKMTPLIREMVLGPGPVR